MRRCVWFRSLKNEEAMARVGPQRPLPTPPKKEVCLRDRLYKFRILKGNKMNGWESFYIQILQQNTLIDEQTVDDQNSLYILASVTRRHVM